MSATDRNRFIKHYEESLNYHLLNAETALARGSIESAERSEEKAAQAAAILVALNLKTRKAQ